MIDLSMIIGLILGFIGGALAGAGLVWLVFISMVFTKIKQILDSIRVVEEKEETDLERKRFRKNIKSG